ncbi:MAG: indolepyruvate oxidoreductase subunit beta [Chloroflexi bacterium]|jgi:indolepyruvate ferredoxin oxidoreductase beta subunit|nr:indolepyruvate oxidoreductase subunit beta [Chloroflexota bacterium]
MTRNDLTTNFLLTGVGGQGTLLAADIVGLVGIQLNLDVKKSEVHGMAQRGGSVISHVRWGQRVASPLIAAGEVDYLVAFERLEALRYASLVRPGGVVLVSDYRIAPVSVSSGSDTYPDAAAEEQAYGDSLRRFLVPAVEIAQQLGQVRVNNIVMLGALSHFLPAPVEAWLEVISGRVPERTIALNREAFAAGRAHMQ